MNDLTHLADVSLDGKIAVVTGGASGIGAAISSHLASRGARVIVGDVSQPEGIGSDRARFFPCDLATADGARGLIEHSVETYGRLDILVNNVGIFPYRAGFLEVSNDQWRHLIDVNFFSMVECCRAALPVMTKQHSGSIIGIGSDLASQPDPFLVDYAVSKVAMVSLSKSLAAEFGPHGVRSNIVSPGPTLTPQWLKPGGFADSLAAEYQLPVEQAIDHYAREIRHLPLGTLLQPTDIAAVVGFLASDSARYVTGSEWCVDAGVRRAI
jgi:NAD(P)-dependent dehydrogenase (short-subunit alcohol dehydrogenase family)